MQDYEINAISICLRRFTHEVNALEWGSGYSTLYYAARLPYGSRWTSVEHDIRWFEQMQDMVRQSGINGIQLHGVPPERAYSEGQDDEDFRCFSSYVLFPGKLSEKYDFILVDGRSRSECMALGWELLKNDGIMVLHDAWRAEYQPGIPDDSFLLRVSISAEGRLASLLFMAKNENALMQLALELKRELPSSVTIVHSFRSQKEKSGRILFINTFYSGFIKNHYQRAPGLENQPYWQQKRSLQEQCFGDSDFYSSGMIAAGWDADDLIVNCPELQSAWLQEQACPARDALSTAIEQVRQFEPDVVYLQDLSLASSDFICSLKRHCRMVAGQIASPVPPQADLSGIDVLFSSFPHFVERFRQQGKTAWYQPLAFEPRLLQRLPVMERQYPVTFVGGVSPHHGKGLDNLQKIAEIVPLDCWGYGADLLPPDSPLRRCHHGQVWGLDMFAILRQSAITVNRHIDVAEDYANNMRLFEATGCGALLITDYRSNLNELFEIGREVVAYRSPEEAAALIKYYQANPAEAAAIAKAGQERTLRDHTYKRRMEQTAEILQRHLYYHKIRGHFPLPSQISSHYRSITEEETTEAMTQAWQDKAIPASQRGLVQLELEQMYAGYPRPHFSALAELIRPIVKDGSSILELGCASGYYYEILEYLMGRRIDYTGVDYSEAMIEMARGFYPRPRFFAADGKSLFFPDHQFDLVISSSVLLHVTEYRRHIEETCRVARNWIVAHRTPVCRKGPTRRMAKQAYGVETVEFCFNEQEFLQLFLRQGFEAVAGSVIIASPDSDEYMISYLLKRVTHSPVLKSNSKISSPCGSNSKTYHRGGPVVLVSRAIAFTFPLAYAYLAGQLRSRGEDVRVLFKDISFEALVKQIMALNPLVVGFGSLYPELAETKELISMLDDAGRKFPVVIGGQMVSPTPEFAVRVTGADYGIIGEGELILEELVQRLRNGADVSDMKGLVIREGDAVTNNGPGPYIENLTTGLPAIPYELFPVEQWLPVGEWYARNLPQPLWKIEDRVINVHGGRGCPFSCNFCYHHSKPRYRDIAVMMEEAQAALIRFDANMLYFSDDLVLATPSRARQLIEAVGNLDRPISFQVSTRFDILAKMDNGLLRDLKRVGCRSMGLGLESGSDRILNIIGKNSTAGQIDEGLERLHTVGIYPSTAIMVGQYTETMEDVAASIVLMKRAVQRDPHINFAFTLATPFPGSQLYKHIFEQGLLRDEQEFYDRYFSSVGDFKQVVNLSSMSNIEVAAALYELQRIYAEEKQRHL